MYLYIQHEWVMINQSLVLIEQFYMLILKNRIQLIALKYNGSLDWEQNLGKVFVSTSASKIYFSCFVESNKFWNVKKSVNLQYITLGCLDDGTNESSTKRLMFQVFFFHDFLQNSLQKSFQFIFTFFL